MANAAYSTRDETTAWLAERQKGIGSSDAAAVCGLDPYRSALECYVEKTSPLEEPVGFASMAANCLRPARSLCVSFTCDGFAPSDWTPMWSGPNCESRWAR